MRLEGAIRMEPEVALAASAIPPQLSARCLPTESLRLDGGTCQLPFPPVPVLVLAYLPPSAHTSKPKADRINQLRAFSLHDVTARLRARCDMMHATTVRLLATVGCRFISCPFDVSDNAKLLP